MPSAVKSGGEWIAGVVLGLLVLSGAAATHAAVRAWLPGSSPPAWLPSAGGLLAFAFAGRVLLACLPAGRLGSSRPRALATTWATSHLAGVVALGFTSVALDTGAGERLVELVGRPAALLLPWSILLAARLASLPAKLVPRHEPNREHAAGWTRALPPAFLVAALVLLATVAVDGPSPRSELTETYLGRTMAAFFPHAGPVSSVFGWASWTAAALLVVHGLAAARRAPAQRWALGLALLATPASSAAIVAAQPELVTALLFAGGCAFGVSWLRRADRRACALAVLAFLALVLTTWSGLLLAAIGLGALIAFTPAPSRRPLALLAGGSWLLLAWPIAGRVTHQLGVVEPVWIETDLGGRLGAAFDPENFGLLFPVLLAALLLGVALRLSRSRGGSSAVDPPGRELAFTATVLALAFLALGRAFLPSAAGAAVPPDAESWSRLVALIALPVAGLAAGLAALRGERPSP